MSEAALTPSARRPPLAAWFVAAILIVATGAFFGARLVVGEQAGPAQPTAGQVKPGPMPQSPQIEAKYGIQFSRVGLTANGGLVDVRLLVLDPAKATPVLGHHSGVQMLLADERAKKVFDTRAMTPGDSNLAAGQGYYILFRNSAGTIRRGDYIDIFVGDLVLNHIQVL